MTFADQLAAGAATWELFEEHVATWHDLPDDAPGASLTLHAYLGLTWEQYKHLVEGDWR